MCKYNTSNDKCTRADSKKGHATRCATLNPRNPVSSGPENSWRKRGLAFRNKSTKPMAPCLGKQFQVWGLGP